MKNICFLNTVTFWGGGEKFYLDYAVGLKNRGYNVFIVCDQNSVLRRKAESHNITTYYLNNTRTFSFLNPLKILKLVQFFMREKIEVVIFSASKDLKIGGWSSYLAKIEKRIYRRGLALPIKNNILNRFLLQECITHIIANSEETKKTVLQNLSDCISPGKIKVMYNGIKPDLFSDRSENRMELIREKGKGIILGNAGRLVEQKGQRYLIDIAKKLRKSKVIFTIFVAGAGHLRKELEEEIEKNDLVNEVVLLGFVEDIQSFMQSIDVFLLTSMWEGFGYVLVEAMICAKPVVAFDLTSNPEIIERDKTGFLVEYLNLDLFTERIIQLANDPAARNTMGMYGRERSLRHFQFENNFQQFEDYIART